MKRILLTLAFLITSTAAHALDTPKNIVLINIDHALTPDEFALLRSRLEHSFNIPFISQEKEFSYRTAFNVPKSQYNSGKLMMTDAMFGNAYAYTSVSIIKDDMYADEENRSSIIMRSNTRRVLLSTYRLQPTFTEGLLHRHLLVDRTYKFIQNAIGLMHGLPRTCGLMGEFKTAQEIDAVSDRYCDNDAVLMRSFGLLK